MTRGQREKCRVIMNLLSFEDVDESQLFLEAINEFVLLSLQSLVHRQQLLHLLLLMLGVLLHTTSSSSSSPPPASYA